MLKAVCIGDPHIKSDNLTEYQLFQERLMQMLERETPDIVVILGDVLHHHEKLYTPSLNRAISFIKTISDLYKTYVLVGNHDMINNQQFLSDNHWMNSLKLWDNGVVIVDRTVYEKINGVGFALVPYVYPGRFVEALEIDGSDEWKTIDVIFAHQEFKGCKMGAIVSEHGDEWLDEYPLVVSGHVHQNQWVGRKVYYTGSAMQHAFGESERNIIAVLGLSPGSTPLVREIDLDLPRKKIVNVDIHRAETFSVNHEARDKTRLTITGNAEDFKTFKKTQKYKELVDGGVKVVFKQKKSSQEDQPHSTDDAASSCFHEILHDIVTRETDPMLYRIYQKIVNDRDEIIIIPNNK
jgi:DNA repair exonuclease SbcCD nuclease subunit